MHGTQNFWKVLYCNIKLSSYHVSNHIYHFNHVFLIMTIVVHINSGNCFVFTVMSQTI